MGQAGGNVLAKTNPGGPTFSTKAYASPSGTARAAIADRRTQGTYAMQGSASMPAYRLKRTKTLLAACVAIPIIVLATLVALPKNSAFAANDRLAMTVLGLTTTLVGIVGFTIALRRYRVASVQTRYAKAPPAMRDTMQFLLHERQLGQRGRLTLMIGATIALALSVLSRWPQLEPLEPYGTAFVLLGLACIALLLVQPVQGRRHIINALYLKRYLHQQAQHIGYSPGAQTECDHPDEPPVVVTAPFSFRAGGFDWTFDDLVKNVLVIGQPGAGKTVCVLNALLEGLIAAGPNDEKTAGLILDPKRTYRHTIGPLCRRLGREDDLCVFSEETWPTAARTPGSIALNPTDNKEDALEVSARFTTTLKLSGGMQTRDSFFPDAARTFIRHGFELTRAALAPRPASVHDVHRLCGESMDGPAFYEELIQTLAATYPDHAPPEIETAVEYFETEWRNLPDRQLAGVRSTVKQILDDFTAQPIAEMVSGPSTISIADIIERGKILYVDLPLAGRERLSRILTTLIRLEFQREILRRPNKSRSSFLFADEFQSLFVAGEEHGDSDFFERSRESNHANVVAAQNMSSFLKKTPNRHDVTNFLGLCAVKIFLRNSERETSEWASSLFGERSEVIVTASEAARLDGGFSRSQTSYGRSARNVRVVPPGAFTALSVPVKGDPARQFTESIVHLGSRATPAKLDLSWRVHPLQP